MSAVVRLYLKSKIQLNAKNRKRTLKRRQRKSNGPRANPHRESHTGCVHHAEQAVGKG